SHVRTSVGGDVGDTRVLGQMAVEVGEGRGHQVNGDRVELNRVNMSGAVVEGRQDLVTASGSYHRFAARRRTQHPKWDRTRVLTEVILAQIGYFSVPAENTGTKNAVVVQVQDVRIAGHPSQINADHRAPTGFCLQG